MRVRYCDHRLVNRVAGAKYSSRQTGRAAPVIYLQMLTVGFFENIGGMRGIAERCSDFISSRAFLSRALTETTADHSTLS